MSYEHYEELNRLKMLLRDLGVFRRLKELEEKIASLEKALDNPAERVFWLECTAEEGEYERE